MVVFVLFSAGDHVPFMPFVEVAGNAVRVVPEQTGVTAAKVGVIFGFTAIVKVACVAHCPTVGVKVYVVVAVLFKAGDQVPVYPFSEVVGRAVNVAPEQIAATGLKVGVTFGLTVIVKVVCVAHCPAVGVNV